MQPVSDTGVMDALPEQTAQIDLTLGPCSDRQHSPRDEDIIGDRFPLPGVWVNGADRSVDALPAGRFIKADDLIPALQDAE